MSPLIVGGKPRHLTTDEWDELNWIYGELHGDLVEEEVAFERRETGREVPF